jgi:putative SOS response-associated peptidase YedK
MDYDTMMEYYQASIKAAAEEVELIRERFQILMSRDERVTPYTPEEIAELKFCQKTLQNFGEARYQAYNENGYDHAAGLIITADEPKKFTLSRWGLVASFQKSYLDAMDPKDGPNTLNARSEEIADKKSYVSSFKKGKRCLIPVTGFFEPHHVEGSKNDTITYLIRHTKQPIFSLGGIYNEYTEPGTGKVYHTYTLMTKPATAKMAFIHNKPKRMPFFVPRHLEQVFLKKELSLEDILAIGEITQDSDIFAHTVSKKVTKMKEETNVPEVLEVFDFGRIGGVDIVTRL